MLGLVFGPVLGLVFGPVFGVFHYFQTSTLHISCFKITSISLGFTSCFFRKFFPSFGILKYKVDSFLKKLQKQFQKNPH